MTVDAQPSHWLEIANNKVQFNWLHRLKAAFYIEYHRLSLQLKTSSKM